MICRCCGMEIEASRARCGVCKFPVLGDCKQSVIDDYRKDIIGKTTVFVKTYTYSIDSGKVVLDAENTLKMADAAELENDKIVWLKQKFFSFAPKRDIDVDLVIKNGQSSVPARVTIRRSNEEIPFERAGIVMKKGFNIALAVGSTSKYVISNEVSVVTP